MPAATTDLLKKYKSLFSTTLSTGIGTGTSDTITPASVEGLPTDTLITLTFDRVDSGGSPTPTKLERIKGIISGGNFTSYTRGVDGTSEQAHAGGAVIEMIWNAADWNDAITWGLTEHSQLGTHTAITANSLAVASGITTSGITASNITSTNITSLKNVTSTIVTTAGGTTTYTLTPSPAITAYATGQEFLIKMNATNTGASTINVSGLGAKSLTKGGATALASSDLLIDAVYKIVYDGTQFQVSGISATVATQAEVATGTDNTKMVTPLAVSRWHMPPQGFLYNGKIVPSVSGGALTVALKTLAGTDPSASDPVYLRIGDAIRSITSALSVTINGGTNWFGIGTAGLAGNETDLFTFIGLKSSDSSYRLMVGRLGIDGQLNQTGYADGDGTANTYIYPYSQIAATDSIALIGRFAATLSAGPGYTWSVPSYTSSNLIQRPVYETRPLSYTPQIGDGSLGNGSISGTYQIMGTRVRVRGKFTLGSTSTVTGNLNFSKPIQTASESTDIGAALAWDNSATVRYISFTTLVAGNIYPHTGTGSYGYYSTTAPMTWATSDTATYDITYWVV